MKNGDLANFVSYSFGFRCEDFLVKYKEDTFSDKILNKIIGKAKRAELDQRVLSVMDYIYRHTEYTVDLVIDNKNYTSELKNVLDALPFNRIVLVDRPSQISQRLLTGDITYYVDDDEERRSLINNQNAVTLEAVHSFVRKR